MGLFDVEAEAYVRFMGRFSAPLSGPFAEIGLAFAHFLALFDDGLPASRWTLAHQETGDLGEIALVYDRAR